MMIGEVSSRSARLRRCLLRSIRGTRSIMVCDEIKASLTTTIFMVVVEGIGTV